MNPMVRKELNLRMRERRGWLLPMLYLVCIGVVVAVTYFESARVRYDLQGSEIGGVIFIVASLTQLTLLLLLTPVFSAGMITIEKEQRTFAALLTSLLSPFQIWSGKLISSLLFVMLLLFSGLPVLALSLSFGGVDLQALLFSSFTLMVVVVAVTVLGLYFSAVFRRSIHASAVTYATVVVLAGITALLWAVMDDYLRSRLAGADDWRPRILLYFNPYYFLIASFEAARSTTRLWLACLGCYSAIIAVFSWLTCRAIARSGADLE